MKKKFTLLLLIIALILPELGYTQTWKSLGVDERNTPSVGITVYTDIAKAPDGTLYMAYNDVTQAGRVSVKRFNGTGWVQVGKVGFSEGSDASGIDLVIAPDGTPYVTYMSLIQGDSFPDMQVRKFTGGSWVSVGSIGGATRGGISPSLTFNQQGVPYLAFSSGAESGLNVQKMQSEWTYLADTTNNIVNINIPHSVVNSSRIVSGADGTIYVVYAAAADTDRVSVKKWVGNSWQFVGNKGFTNKGASNVTMSIAPNGTIYVAYQDSLNGNKAVVQVFTGGKWSQSGLNALSIGQANYLDIATGPDNVPYVIFSDAGNKSMATVKRLTGGSWVNAGTGVISPSTAAYTRLIIGSDGIPYTIFTEEILADKAIVKKFSGNQWTDVGGGDITSGASASLSLKITNSGSTYVAFNDPAYNGRASVKQYSGGSWQYLGQPGISQANATELDMNAGPDGTPYIIYNDTTQRFLGIVKKYNGSAWIQVGGPITSKPGVNGGVLFMKIAIAPDGTPYAAYSDYIYGGQITVLKYTSGAWAIVGRAGFSPGTVTDVNIAIDKNNVLYVGYADITTKKATIRKFDGSNWTPLGTENFSPSATKDLNLVIAPDGTPYVTYYDPNKGKIAVEAFSNNSWGFIGGQAASDSSGAVPKLVFGQNNQLYVGFIQLQGSLPYVERSIVEKLNQNAWTDIGSQGMLPWTGTDDAIAISPSGDLIYAYLNSQVFVRTKTSDSLAVAPVVTGCSPTSGGAGTLVTITGFNFSGASVVKIGQSPAASFKVLSPTVITAVAGAGTSGTVNITTAKGSGSFDGFTFGPVPPVITSFTPQSGELNSTVTIHGKNFGKTITDNFVYFGAVTATILSANDSTLQVKVPAGATYVPISVTARQLTAYAAMPFDVTFKSAGTINAASFSAHRDLPTLIYPGAVLVTDLDNDGKPDLVAGGGGTTLFHNTSTVNNLILTGQNSENPNEYPVFGTDFDGDGKQDVVYNNAIALNGSQPAKLSFSNTERLLAVYNGDAAMGDIDGDGRPDIVQNNGILRNAGAISQYIYFDDQVNLPTLAGPPQSYTLSDLDGDGKPDLAVIVPDDINYSGAFYLVIFKNTSTPNNISFVKVAQYTTEKNPGKPVISDVDGDGKPDLVVPNAKSNTVTIYRNLGTAVISFAAGVDLVTGNAPTAACAADLDGDGKPEIAVTNGSDNTVSVFKNTSTAGNIAFGPKVDFKTGNGPYAITAADLDGDGAPELITTSYGGSNISVLRNNMGIVSLPVNNFTIAITSATCKGSANGTVTITAAQSMPYTATITGNSLNKAYGFSSTTTIDSLAAGSYNVCLTISGQPGYSSCYTVVITEPKDLSVYSVVNNNNTLDLHLGGGSLYNVNLNGKLYVSTTDSTVTVPLIDGNNDVTVSTDRACQGIVEKNVNVGKLIPYPNPFQGPVNVNLGSKLIGNVIVEVHSLSNGKQVYFREYTNLSGVMQVDLSGLENGVYAFHLTMDNSERVFKIIKK